MVPLIQRFAAEWGALALCAAVDVLLLFVAFLTRGSMLGNGLVLLTMVAIAGQAGAWFALKLRRERRTVTEDRVSAIFRRTMDQRKSAIRDEATGLVYRWYLDMRLEQEAARCRRYELSMAVVVLRAGLVPISEWHSDDWRDSAADAAQRAAKVVRNVDLSASLGPLEYAFCLVHCDRDGALRAIERMVTELDTYTCEAGIAIYPDDHCPPASLIELAKGRVRPVSTLSKPSSAA